MEKVKKQKSHRKVDVTLQIVIWTLFTLLMLYVLTMVFVLGWGMLTSLKWKDDFNGIGGATANVIGLPNLSGKGIDLKPAFLEAFKQNCKNALAFANYGYVFKNFHVTDAEEIVVWFGTKRVRHATSYGFGMILLNSLIYALGNSIVQVTCFTIMGYMCAKYQYKLSKIIVIMVIVLMGLPIIGALPSELTLLRNLNLYDNWVGNFIQKFGFLGMYFLVFYEYFKGVPDTYRDAAEIDGANQMTVFLRIYLPMAMKIIGSVVLIRFVFHWNDYSSIRLYMKTHATLSYALFYNVYVDGSSIAQKGTPGLIAAGMMLAIPIIVLFCCFQNKIMGSMTLGGIKE